MKRDSEMILKSIEFQLTVIMWILLYSIKEPNYKKKKQNMKRFLLAIICPQKYEDVTGDTRTNSVSLSIICGSFIYINALSEHVNWCKWRAWELLKCKLCTIVKRRIIYKSVSNKWFWPKNMVNLYQLDWIL